MKSKTKKAIVLSIVLTLLLAVFPIGKLSVSADNYYPLISVSGDVVNVRKGPGLNYPVIFQVARGDLLEKLGSVKSSSGDVWYKIYDFNRNKVAYIASWLVSNSGVSIAGENADFTTEVTTDVLNARIGPGTAFKVVDVLSKGDKKHITRIINRSDGEIWYRYKENGKYFYIAGWYTKKVVPENKPEKKTNNTNPVAQALYYINIRQGPSIDYGKVGLISKGDSVSIVGVAKNSYGEVWIEVYYNGVKGWSLSTLFTISQLPNVDFSPIGGEASTLDYVNLRSGPSTDYAIEVVLTKGTNCSVVGVAQTDKSEVWYEVKVNGKLGWIRSDLINLKTVEKGEISKVTWRISSNGIDVIVYGSKLPAPSISILENPIRLNAHFKNTILSKNANALGINIPPIIRVRYNQNGLSTDVIVDLTDRIPFKTEVKSGNFVITLELPKKGQKRVEVADSEVYSDVLNENNEEYIELKSVVSALEGRLNVDSDSAEVIVGSKEISIPVKDLLRKDGEFYISLSALEKYFNVNISEFNNTIFVDPVLTSLKRSKDKIVYEFSIPPQVKKSKVDDETVYYIYASAGKYSGDVNFTKRVGEAPPKITVKAKDSDILVNGRIITIEQSNVSNKGILAGRIIVIDPGHGSYSGPYLDTGATGPTGVKEGVVVLEIAKLLKALLEKDGAKVILTHDTLDNPNNPTLAQRCAIANHSGGDLFMSIHLNASVSREAHGTETYYWHSDSKRLAEVIQHSLVSELGTTDRGVKRDYLYVCRNVTTMPAILTEVVFVSNPHEEALCKQKSFLEKVAKALRDGIVEYLTGENGG